MIEEFINKILRGWVANAERFPLVTLLVIFVATLFASHYTTQHFSINSDLDRLIKPTKVIEWYQDDRNYRAAFPQYQEKALVVVSSQSAEKAYVTGEILYKALRQHGEFEEVFAPEFDDFANEHALYGAPTEGVRYLAEKVQESLPGLAKIYSEPGIPNFMHYLQSVFNQSADMEVLTPEVRYQFEVLDNALVSLDSKSAKPSLAMIKKLMPQDDGNTSYHFISVKDFKNYSINMPYQVTMNKIRAVIENAHIDSDVQVRITGEVALENDELTEGMDGVQIAGSISTVLILFILVVGIGYGRHSVILNSGMFLMLFVGIIWTTFVSLLVVGKFSTLSIIFLVMFFGLGVEFAIHYTLCMENYVYNEDPGGVSPNVAAASNVGIPLMLSALSAIIGFLSFLPTSYVGLAELGVVSAIGMAAAFIGTLTFLPAWFKLFGITRGKYAPRRLAGIGEKFGHFFSRNVSLSPLTIVTVIGVLAGTSLYYAKDVRFNYSHLAMRNAQSEAMVTLTEIQKQGMVTDYSIAVMVNPDTDLQAYKEKLLALPSVAKVELPGDHIPLFQNIKQQYMQTVAQQLEALGVKGQALPLDSASIQQTLSDFVQNIASRKNVFLDEDLVLVNRLEAKLNKLQAHPELWPELQESVATGIETDVSTLRLWFTAKPFGLQDLPNDVRSWFMSSDGRLLVNVIPKNDMSNIANMDQFIAEVHAVSPNIAGRTIVEWGVGNMVIDAFKQAAVITFAAIFVLLWLNFRKITTVILVFTPLILTTIFMFAIMKFIGLTLNMANILVVPMLFGLGVDMGIHVVDKYYKCLSVDDMVVSYTTRSVVLGALTTVSSFVALSFSPHKGAASIGLLLSISMLLLLAVTYIVLPALLAIFQGRNEPHPSQADIAKG